MISALIPALNEARNISECLKSIAWCDEAVVVDSGSQDETRQIASSFGAKIVEFKWNGVFPKKKNWALQNIQWKGEWVLILDADERITPELAAEIQRELKCPRADGYFINRRFMFLEKWIRHCGYYPSWNLRLFRHSLGRYENIGVGDTGSGDNEVHEHVILKGTTAYLKEDMLHFAYPNIHTWMEKHNRYSNWEAAVEAEERAGHCGEARIGTPQLRRRRLRTLSRRLPFRPLLRFFYSYVLERGFLDGYEGYIFCRLLATYEMLNVYKAFELRQAVKALAPRVQHPIRRA